MTTGTASAPGTPGVMLLYPTNLGANGFDHPIITAGNGTGSNCAQAVPANSHLASWGYVVVCADSGATGSGAEIWAAAQWLISQNSNSSSVFFGDLDTNKVGAMGHSQGASGAVNAMIQSNGVIKSTVALALVDPIFQYWSGFQAPNFGQVHDPLFLATGTTDFLTSQSQQQAYYNATAGPVAKAALAGLDHGGMIEPSFGYDTAWFKYTLEGDQFARSAFVGNPPEVATNPAWTNWAAKNLP